MRKLTITFQLYWLHHQAQYVHPELNLRSSCTDHRRSPHPRQQRPCRRRIDDFPHQSSELRFGTSGKCANTHAATLGLQDGGGLRSFWCRLQHDNTKMGMYFSHYRHVEEAGDQGSWPRDNAGYLRVALRCAAFDKS